MVQLLDLPEGQRNGWKAAQVEYVSYFCGRPIDAIEFATGMAPAADCLTPEKITMRGGKHYVEPGIGMLPDDSPAHVVCLPTKYVRVKTRKEVQTIMVVTEIEQTSWLLEETP